MHLDQDRQLGERIPPLSSPPNEAQVRSARALREDPPSGERGILQYLGDE